MSPRLRNSTMFQPPLQESPVLLEPGRRIHHHRAAHVCATARMHTHSHKLTNTKLHVITLPRIQVLRRRNLKMTHQQCLEKLLHILKDIQVLEMLKLGGGRGGGGRCSYVSCPFLKKLTGKNVFCFSYLFIQTTFISFLKNYVVYNFHYKGSTARCLYEPKYKFFSLEQQVCLYYKWNCPAL